MTDLLNPPKPAPSTIGSFDMTDNKAREINLKEMPIEEAIATAWRNVERNSDAPVESVSLTLVKHIESQRRTIEEKDRENKALQQEFDEFKSGAMLLKAKHGNALQAMYSCALDDGDCYEIYLGLPARKKNKQLIEELQSRVREWIPIESGLPEGAKGVLAAYKNSLGSSRIIKAKWVPKFFEEYNYDHDGLDAEYCEEKDCYYWPEGWYEMIDNWDDYSAVFVHEGEITHWMPLPEPPITPPGEKKP